MIIQNYVISFSMEWAYFYISLICVVTSSILLLHYATLSGGVLGTTYACNSSFSFFKYVTIYPNRNTFSSMNISMVISGIYSHTNDISFSSHCLSSTASFFSFTTISFSIFIHSIYSFSYAIFSRVLTN